MCLLFIESMCATTHAPYTHRKSEIWFRVSVRLYLGFQHWGLVFGSVCAQSVRNVFATTHAPQHAQKVRHLLKCLLGCCGGSHGTKPLKMIHGYRRAPTIEGWARKQTRNKTKNHFQSTFPIQSHSHCRLLFLFQDQLTTLARRRHRGAERFQKF